MTTGETIQLIGVGVALLLGLVGIFRESIRDAFFRPKLRLAYDAASGDVHYIPIHARNVRTDATKDIPAWFVRIRVFNRGSSAARQVEVVVTKVERRSADDAFAPYVVGLPINLKWSHSGGQLYFPHIASGMPKHCDLVHISAPGYQDRGVWLGEYNPDDRTNFRDVVGVLEFAVQPTTRIDLLPPGEYRITLAVAAENAATVEYVLRLRITGAWPDPAVGDVTPGVVIDNFGAA